MAVDQKTPSDQLHPIDFEQDVVQRRPITTQTGLGGVEPRMVQGVLANDDNIVFTTVNNLVTWARSRSPWPLGYGLACCAIQMISASMAHHDTPRCGMEAFRSRAREPDVVLLGGTVTDNKARPARG